MRAGLMMAVRKCQPKEDGLTSSEKEILSKMRDIAPTLAPPGVKLVREAFSMYDNTVRKPAEHIEARETMRGLNAQWRTRTEEQKAEIREKRRLKNKGDWADFDGEAFPRDCNNKSAITMLESTLPLDSEGDQASTSLDNEAPPKACELDIALDLVQRRLINSGARKLPKIRARQIDFLNQLADSSSTGEK